MEKNMISNLEKWKQWFVGFTDAEGNFQVYSKTRTFKSGQISKINVGYGYHLSLHKRDLTLLKDVQSRFKGIGSIYSYTNKSDARLAVNDKTGLLYLIENVFDVFPLVTKNQSARFSLLKMGLIDNIKEFSHMKLYDLYVSNSMYSVNNKLYLFHTEDKVQNVLSSSYVNNWIIGFINGEGCFYLNKNKRNFCIEHTDENSLNIIKQKLCFGVFKRAPRARDVGKVIKPTYRLIVSSKNYIDNLIAFLDDVNNIPLQGNKYIQYCEWKQHKQ